MQKLKQRGSAVSWFAAREILPGFPAEPFQSLEDIEAYCGNERVVCLLCGKAYKTLLVHVTRIHQMDEADYRTHFNIPAKYPLCASSVSEFRSRHWHSRRDEMLALSAAALEAARDTPRDPANFVRTTFKLDAARRNAKLATKASVQSRKDATDCHWHLEQVAAHRYYSDIPPPDGELSWSGFKKRRVIDGDLNARFKAARGALPNICKAGHPRTDENTYVYIRADGVKARSCRLCNLDAQNRYVAKLSDTA